MNRIVHIRFAQLGLLLLALLISVSAAQAQTTSFTYQGRFTDNQNGGNATNGTYDFQFKLFDALNGGNQIGGAVDRNAVTVTSSAFTVQLDFGAAAFPGANRFLEISARPAGNGSFSTLNPRQPVTSTPYAIKSLSAAVADTATTANNAQQLGGQTASQFVLTGDARLSDARTPTAGSANYVQNTTAQQGNSNFNISGNGTAGGTLSGNVVNAGAQFNLSGNRLLGVSKSSNTFAGFLTGASITTGDTNTFFGHSSGNLTNTGSFNAFFGGAAGRDNTSGATNAFFGTFAGQFNVSGSNNTFVGENAGAGNTTGSNNTILGAFANVPTGGLTNATAVGAQAQVSQSNSLVLGSINGVNGATANTNVGIGTTAPGSLLTLKASSNTATALEVNQGAIKVTGAGIRSDKNGTGTAVFVHKTTAANILDGYTTFIENHPLASGDPNAILIVTHNVNAGGGAFIANAHPISVWFDGANWRILNADGALMPVGTSFNVMVIKP